MVRGARDRPDRPRGWPRVAVAPALVLVLVVATGLVPGTRPGAPSLAGAATAGVLPGTGFYPRAVALHHAGAQDGTVLATTNDGVVGRIWRSTDQGATFAALSSIVPGPGTDFLCCIALYELPVAAGPFPAGTLLWAGSVGTDPGPPRHMDLRVWRSDDHGVTWTAMSSCGTSTTGGLWEPDFHVAADGRLVCLFSDETDQPAHSQILAQTISSDGGQTWGPTTPVVASAASWVRPGMGTVAALPDGRWAMSYELCAAAPNCAVRIRFSSDGLDWGPPDDLGTRVVDVAGGYLAHTPVLSWTPAGGASGTLLLSGQILFEADDAVAAGNGRTLFVNHQGGAGPWTPIEAPVAVADPVDNFCPNYSSPVIDLDGDGLLLELASSWQGPNCVTSFGTARVDLVPPTTTTTSPTAPSSTTTTTTSSPVAVPAPVAAAPVRATPAFTG